jgi:DNA-binding NarL/FixJ family response regulator
MNTGVRQSFQPGGGNVRPPSENTHRWSANAFTTAASNYGPKEQGIPKARVRVAAENRLLHGALSHMLAKRADMEVLGAESTEVFRVEALIEDLPDLLLLTSRGNLDEDISLIRKIRNTAPSVQIVMFGGAGGEVEFLQYVRAGIRGYLLPDASAEDVLEAMLAVHEGKAVCPSSLCGLLFHYFEREATTLSWAAMRQRLGLTRREQQLIPLIAQGLTNKEIANHFCLSEQTVKNHLYRMKHKVGADNRLGIVQTCHAQGFLL